MIRINGDLTPAALKAKTERMFDLSAQKIQLIQQSWDPGQGTPVFTVQGRYTTRGWTEWTQGFMVAASSFSSTPRATRPSWSWGGARPLR